MAKCIVNIPWTTWKHSVVNNRDSMHLNEGLADVTLIVLCQCIHQA